MLTPLSKSNYSVLNTEDFVSIINAITPAGYVAVFFDVVSLFTNIPLKKTIDILLRKVYQEKLIEITQKTLKNYYKCAPKGHHSPSTRKYTHRSMRSNDMGSPLGDLIANIFMRELENTIIPTLGDKIQNWKRYVDDVFAFIRQNTEDKI